MTKQNFLALSNTEAEFVAMSETTQLMLWGEALLEKLGASDEKATEVNADKQGALIWVKKEFG